MEAMAELDDAISKILSGSKTLLQKAAEGDFAHVKMLKDHFPKPSPEIDKLLAVKCVKAKRNLIHWLAHHNQLEILEWIRGKDSRSVPSSSGSQGDGPTIALKRKDSNHFNAQDVYGFTALHVATWGSHEEIVQVLLAHDTWVDVDVVAENMIDLDGNEMKRNGQTALHIAAAKGDFCIVKMLLDCLKDRMQDRVKEGRAEFREALSIKSTSGKTALHYAAENGNCEVVKCLLEAMKLCEGVDIVNYCDVLRQTPLSLAVSTQNADVVEILLREGEGLKVNTVTWEGITPLDIAKRNEAQRRKEPRPKYFAKKTEVVRRRLHELKKRNQRIVDMLESYDISWLHAERSKYANAANCLLVGAALIATVTYAGCLQPPLGITQYYEFSISNAAAPPEAFESYVGVKQHQAIQLFWIFNIISFFCSIATFIIGADAGIPKRCASLRDEVVQLRQSTVTASFILSIAIVGVMGAFSVAGILVLPPIERQRAPTYVTVALGMILCLTLLVLFMKKLWIWFWSPSLQFKLDKDHHKDHPSEEITPDATLPEKGTPNDGSPKQVTQNDGSSEQATQNDGSPERATQNDGSLEQATQNDGSPEQTTQNDESPKQATPNDGSLEQATPNDGSSKQATPDGGPLEHETPNGEPYEQTTPNDGPSTLVSANSWPIEQRRLSFGSSTGGSANSRLHKPRRPNNRLLEQGRTNMLEISNSKAVGKRKYDNICEPFDEQQRRRSFRRYSHKLETLSL